MKRTMVPELWLMVLIVLLPQLTETVYTASLPDIAASLLTSHALVEYTLTIFLFGLALGTLFWGKVSDIYGRKPALLVGLGLYSVGCIGCYYSATISLLMLSRFVQAFGVSTGSVLGQTICRDVFFGFERSRVFSIISSALALSPALGPIIGGCIDQYFGWSAIFLFLMLLGLITLFLVYWRLPETYTPTVISASMIKKTILALMTDRRVLGFGLLVGLSNGMSFSYFAEGSFYLMTLLHLTPSLYGSTFILLALAALLGGYSSKKMNERQIGSWSIINCGMMLLTCGVMIYLMGMFLATCIHAIDFVYIGLILISMVCITVGSVMMIPNILSIALVDYPVVQGTAASLFGCYYYCLISLCTLIMGCLHNHTLWPMPVYFFVLAIIMNIVCYSLQYNNYQ